MFIPVDEEPVGLRPRTCEISANDWQVLSRYWYPVAVAGDVKHSPVKGKLLDVDLVIYRTQGRITVAQDRCPHRYIRLSAGRIADDRIVCPFHGLNFDAAGQCTRIPALGRDAHIPACYRLRVFRSEVRYGLVWACLDDRSAEPIPKFRAAIEAGSDDRLAFAVPRDWPASAARQMENFLDVAHIPLVHARTLGGDPDAKLAPPQVEQTEDGLIVKSIYHENPGGRGPDERGLVAMSLTYIVTLPFMIEFEHHTLDPTAAPDDIRVINVPVPISAHVSRVFGVVVLDEPSPSNESGPGPGDAVNLEDIAILEQIAEPDLPLDQNHEIHIPPDNVSLEYRKRLRALGLGRA